MIGLMVSNLDEQKLPGTPYPVQGFVVASGIAPTDLYKPGLRSGYHVEDDYWIVPPDRSRVLDIEKERRDTYTYALQVADKMDRLLLYEPHKAGTFWHQLHRRRKNDQIAGKGDFSPSNIAYKMIVNRGYIPRIEEATGEYIAT
jgi:hypothetical protein